MNLVDLFLAQLHRIQITNYDTNNNQWMAVSAHIADNKSEIRQYKLSGINVKFMVRKVPKTTPGQK